MDFLTEVYPVEGPAQNNPCDLVMEAIKLIRSSEAAGTSLSVAIMLTVSGVEELRNLIEDTTISERSLLNGRRVVWCPPKRPRTSPLHEEIIDASN